MTMRGNLVYIVLIIKKQKPAPPDAGLFYLVRRCEMQNISRKGAKAQRGSSSNFLAALRLCVSQSSFRNRN